MDRQTLDDGLDDIALLAIIAFVLFVVVLCFVIWFV
jgi:hypothetical protein